MSIGIRDANEVDLLSGVTLTEGTDTGTSVALHADGTYVSFVLSTTQAGANGESFIGIQVSTDDFSTDTRDLGYFAPIETADGDETRYLDLTIPGLNGVTQSGAIWVRAVTDVRDLATGNPDLTGTTLFARQGGYGLNDPTRSA